MSIFEPRAHVFVDESKSRGYIVAAVAANPSEVSQLDKDLRKLVRRGQARVHFNSESDSSRRALLGAMTRVRVKTQLYIVRDRSDKDARRLCLEALVTDLAASRASRLIIERDESLVAADRRIIRTALMRSDYLEDLAYVHAEPTTHAILWISDAVAWSYQAGGQWIARAAPLVGGIKTLP